MNEPKTEIEIVQAFLAALVSADIDRALGYVAPEIVYQNVPLPPARGIEEFTKQMRVFATLVDSFDVITHHIASNGPFVLTERTDAFGLAGARSSFWVCGTFEVRNGKIVLWRDSFDWVAVTVSTVRALPRALFGTIASKLSGRKLTPLT